MNEIIVDEICMMSGQMCSTFKKFMDKHPKDIKVVKVGDNMFENILNTEITKLTTKSKRASL